MLALSRTPIPTRHPELVSGSIHPLRSERRWSAATQPHGPAAPAHSARPVKWILKQIQDDELDDAYGEVHA